MDAYVIWLDSREAKVFKLAPTGVERKHLEGHGRKRHADPHGKHSEQHHPESEALFKDLAAALVDAGELLILGPGEAKTRFKGWLERHDPKGLAKRIVGVETVDHPKENEIVAKAREFFKHYDLFH